MGKVKELNTKVFDLYDQGLTSGKIAQKLKVKKAIVEDILGNANNKGLGSTIEKITEATGIKAVVEAIVDDCGCKARAEELNKLFPSRKLENLSGDDFDYLDAFFSKTVSSVNSVQQKELVRIYNYVFNAKRAVSNCSPCVANMVRELRQIYEVANNQ